MPRGCLLWATSNTFFMLYFHLQIRLKIQMIKTVISKHVFFLLLQCLCSIPFRITISNWPRTNDKFAPEQSRRVKAYTRTNAL